MAEDEILRISPQDEIMLSKKRERYKTLQTEVENRKKHENKRTDVIRVANIVTEGDFGESVYELCNQRLRLLDTATTDIDNLFKAGQIDGRRQELLYLQSQILKIIDGAENYKEEINTEEQTRVALHNQKLEDDSDL